MAVIFDFNGTLFNDTKKQEEAWKAFIKKTYDRTLSDKEFSDHVNGQSNDYIMRYFSPITLTKEEIDSLVEQKERIYQDLCYKDYENTRLEEGAAKLFNELVERNIPIAIATASPLINVNFYIKEFSLLNWFKRENIVYDDGRIKGKPDPEIYIVAMNRLGARAEDTIIVEDSKFGIRSAFSAGCKKIIKIDRPYNSDLDSMDGVIATIKNFNEFDLDLL